MTLSSCVPSGNCAVSNDNVSFIEGGAEDPNPSGNISLGVFDPDGRLIATDYNNVRPRLTNQQYYTFKADRTGIYDVLLQGAGPAANGTVDADRVVQNAAVLIGPEQGEAMLAQWLYEYVSFALFVAEPLLRQGEAPVSRASPEQRELSRRVAELIAPLAPG